MSKYIKGSVRWDGTGYKVVYSYLFGVVGQPSPEVFARWTLAIGEYREHDRTVREMFSNSEKAGVAQ